MSDQSNNPAVWIRTAVFGVPTQRQFAEMLGYAQPNISRVETGHQRISVEMQQRIRDLAEGMGIAWDNNWFFSVPVVRDGADGGAQAACG